MATPRTADVDRQTKETHVRLSLNLDQPSDPRIHTPVGFLNHMLDTLARHGGLGLSVEATGDTHIDDHHTVEDVGIALGQALAKAIGNGAGIFRFATAHCPLDGSLVRAVIDVSGRSGLVYEVPLTPAAGGTKFDYGLMQDFFKGLTEHAKITLHIDLLRGDHSNHHRVEAAVKALAVALRQAVALRPGSVEIPSAKGVL